MKYNKTKINRINRMFTKRCTFNLAQNITMQNYLVILFFSLLPFYEKKNESRFNVKG